MTNSYRRFATLGKGEVECSIHSGGTIDDRAAALMGTTPGISCETPEAARAPLSLDKSGTLGLCARALLLEVI